ncbi:hypothetical protein SEA_SAVAGE2526_39 [Arthrobacter phage Savage2526]|uniref:Uncharacterized protein n=4 Tax=Korravirus TaxID=1982076 RepID=A0A4D6E482_9CAUD|nr:hypothetical protein RAP15_39 [Arthrobacter phage RAP15]ATW58970.1 hypothetical protein PHIRE_MEGANNOLL_38 [Arthrobacter phage MeganNoll]AZS10154.1 hypothetical protein SEA_SAVAGE2526_39 [Arthrobacter phage Savage2526]QBZ73291.1 hypothetical protein SEA_MRGLOOPY_39 [Arthrobacter phage MrGloopy]WAB10087.1 hypothetical protein SEA_JUMBOSET_39 [Arthrobacter phage Jumboset]
MSNTDHYTATVEIVKVSRGTAGTEYNSSTRRNEPKPGERTKEEVMKVVVRDESLRGLVNKVTAILEVNVPTPAMVAEREGE